MSKRQRLPFPDQQVTGAVVAWGMMSVTHAANAILGRDLLIRRRQFTKTGRASAALQAVVAAFVAYGYVLEFNARRAEHREVARLLRESSLRIGRRNDRRDSSAESILRGEGERLGDQPGLDELDDEESTTDHSGH